MKKLLTLFVLFLLGAIVYFTASPYLIRKSSQLKLTPHLSQVLPAQTSTSKSVSEPATLQIPSIGTNAKVESVGLDPEKKMDVPSQVEDTAWYNLGPKPGEPGNSVIDGHLDTPTGTPSVFWDLKKLKSGDQIIITDNLGKQYKFSVDKVENYSFDQFPLQQVFGDSSGYHLNLITCGGVWDRATHNYSERTVAYSSLQP